MCWVIPISRNKRAFHTLGTEDGAATGKADTIKCCQKNKTPVPRGTDVEVSGD
jgi:hypothetical protein